jgi:hypothetical protein
MGASLLLQRKFEAHDRGPTGIVPRVPEPKPTAYVIVIESGLNTSTIVLMHKSNQVIGSKASVPLGPSVTRRRVASDGAS